MCGDSIPRLFFVQFGASDGARLEGQHRVYLIREKDSTRDLHSVAVVSRKIGGRRVYPQIKEGATWHRKLSVFARLFLVW